MAPKYELTYFDVRGRAEVLRLVFAEAGVDYVDKRITKDWATLKQNYPQGTLPVLSVDGGLPVSQSMAILRFLGREFNLYGKNNMDSFLIDHMIDTIGEFVQKANSAFFESDEAKKTALIDEFQKNAVPKFLKLLEKAVEMYGQAGYAAGSTFSIADIGLFNAIEHTKCTKEVEKYPLLLAVKKNVETRENISKYLSTRKQSPF